MRKKKIVPLGHRFGRYTVVENERYVIHGRSRLRACLVRCDCGVERTVANMNLWSENSGSCGCGRFGAKVVDREWKVLYSQLKSRSNDLGRPFELTLSQFITIAKLPCAYCKIAPYNKFHLRRTIEGVRQCDFSNPLVYSGIDRVDSSGGYVAGNVVPCCAFCNRAKDDWTVGEFISRLHRYGSCDLQEADIVRLAASLISP